MAPAHVIYTLLALAHILCTLMAPAYVIYILMAPAHVIYALLAPTHIFSTLLAPAHIIYTLLAPASSLPLRCSLIHPSAFSASQLGCRSLSHLTSLKLNSWVHPRPASPETFLFSSF